MEILSPQALWKDYDRRALPLDVSVISSKTENGVTQERFYFSGERTANGVTRVFARLWIPAEPDPPVVIVMNDVEVSIDDFDATELTAAGYAVLAVDYTGECDKRERYTLYPKEFEFANYFRNPDTVRQSTSSPKLSCWYIWTTILMRAVTFVESDERLTDTVGIMGVGFGGSQIYKVAAIEDETVKCGVTVFSSSTDFEEADIDFKTALDNAGYTPLGRFPVLIAACSNDREGFFDRVSGFFGLAADNYYLTVGERVGHVLLNRQRHTVELFLNRYLKMGLPLDIDTPVLTAKQSERQLYYNIKADEKQPVAKAELFVAYETEIGAFRNWRCFEALSVGDGEYIAKVPVYNVSAPIYAFVSVTYEDGFTFSSPLLCKTPSLIGVCADNLIKSRLVYDSDSGVDDFISVFGGDDLVMKEGAFGIDGVCSLSGALATYKIGDAQYRADTDSILQLIVYSDVEQEITFSVRTSANDGKVEYVCRKKLERNTNWTKVTLSAGEFKSREGALSTFVGAVYFCISGENLLVNTMLWV